MATNDTAKDHTQSKDVERTLEELRQNYARKLPDKVSELDRLWRKLRYLNWNSQAFSLLHRLTHSLVGSGKTFGFAAVTDAAMRLDQLLQSFIASDRAPNQEEQQAISTLISELHLAYVQPAHPEDTTTLPTLRNDDIAAQRARRLVYLVDDDTDVAKYLSEQLAATGYTVRCFHSIGEIYPQLDEEIPAAVIMDIMFPEGSLAGIEAVSGIRGATGVRTPLLFLSARSDLTARLRAIRAGGDAYITKPANIEVIVNKLDECTLPRTLDADKVLVIDDDEDLAAYYESILAMQHIDTRIVTNPINALEAVLEFRPDLILMDYNMPDIDGLELASVIRQEEGLFALPIVFVTAESDASLHDKVTSLGGEAFLTKPVDERALVDTVKKAIRNSRSIANKAREVSQKDPTTGMVNRKFFLSRLENTVAAGSGADSKGALIYITVDHFDTVKSQVGILNLEVLLEELGERILHNTSKTEVICHLAEGAFGVISQAFERDSVLKLAEEIRKSISEQAVTIESHKLNLTASAGVVSITDAVSGVKDAFGKAEQAAEAATMAGGNRVIQYQQEGARADTDTTGETIKGVVAQAIEQQAFRLAYQPILTMAGEQQEFYQVILRMVDQGDRQILPSQYLPIARDLGALYELDRWTIEHGINALSESARTRNEGTFLITVSTEVLDKNTFFPWLSNCLGSSRLRGEQQLVLMLREEDALMRSKQVRQFVDFLSKTHCGFGIEGFGSTDGSEKLIEAVHVNYIKLTAGLVNKAVSNNASKRRLQDLISIAKDKGASVVVESVEDPKTMVMLWELGVRHFQGCYIDDSFESVDSFATGFFSILQP